MKNRLQRRLVSLDILRGLTLFLLVFLHPVLWELLGKIDTPWASAMLYHLDHEVWQGFRFWDLIMPLFLFMSGTSLPFSLSGYIRGEPPKSQAYRKVAKRFIILFLLGMIVQGNLLGFNPDAIYIYTNTLQAIATGYLVTALLLLNFSWRGQLISVVALMAAYAIPMAVTGDYTPEGNLANRIDAMILGRFRGDPSYTWILSSLTFSVTVWLGAACGQLIKGGTNRPNQTALHLALIGSALVLAGHLWGINMPVIKRIWTCSMTLLSGGYCFLLMSLFYYWTDVKGRSRGLQWLKIYGTNSIAAYMLGEVVNFRSAIASISYGTAQWFGPYYSVWLTFGNFLLIFLILHVMFRANFFIKV